MGPSFLRLCNPKKNLLRVVLFIWVQSGLFLLINRAVYFYGGDEGQQQQQQQVEPPIRVIEKLVLPEFKFR